MNRYRLASLVSGEEVLQIPLTAYKSLAEKTFTVCVGRHLAEAVRSLSLICLLLMAFDQSVWMMLVSIVSVMDVKKALDSDGKEIEPEIAFTPGLSRYVKSSHLQPS